MFAKKRVAGSGCGGLKGGRAGKKSLEKRERRRIDENGPAIIIV